MSQGSIGQAFVWSMWALYFAQAYDHACCPFHAAMQMHNLRVMLGNLTDEARTLIFHPRITDPR